MSRLLSMDNIPECLSGYTYSKLTVKPTPPLRKAPFDKSVVSNMPSNFEVKNNLQSNVETSTEIKKESTWSDILKKQATQFCLETGLHGYKYIVQAHRSKTERIIWAIIVSVSLCCAIALMFMTWEYYVTHPTLTVIESTHHGIWNYPFPAITLCDINRVSLNLTQQLVGKLKIPPDMTREYIVQEMRLLNELLEPGVFEHDVRKNLTRLQNIIDDNGLTIPDVIRTVTRSCDDLLEACKWAGNPVNCSGYFATSLSRTGLCCSFNYIAAENHNDPKKFKPLRVTACGYQTGISVLLKFRPDDYHASTLGSIGAKVLIHSPYNYPDFNAARKLVKMGSQVFVTIEPETTYSMAGVRNLAIPMRSCIFRNEAPQLREPLKNRNFTFQAYSYLNCLAECRATIIREKCGCIPYYVPQNNTKVCTLRDVECLYKFKNWYDTSWPGVELTQNILSNQDIDISKRPCGCVPDCDFDRYIVEISHGTFDGNVYYVDLTYSRDAVNAHSLQNHSILHVFFGDLISKQYRRHVHYNWRNLFASFGGLLGLFAGFSLLSVFELIYFFIIRVIVDAFTKKEK